MSNSYIQPKADFFAQLAWTLTQKYRKLLIALLLLLIFILSSYAYFKYAAMQKELLALKAFEPVYVLKVVRDLNVGDAIQVSDLAIAKIFRHEFESLRTKLPNQDLESSVLFECNSEFALSSCVNIVGRVLKIPIYKGSMLRQEMIAQEGVEPGIVNLLAEDEAFLDLSVPQTGFNVYLKPNDYVDVYSISKENSKLISRKAKIIMIDALPLGRAPMQVKVEPNLSRNISLAVRKDDLYNLTSAVKEKRVYLTLHNPKEQESLPVIKAKRNYVNQKNLFQSLTLIQGDSKEIIKQ